MSKLYFWGKTISPSFKTTSSNIQIQSLNSQKTITALQCGAEHCIIKTDDNELYGFGSNKQGQLGLNFYPHQQVQVSKIFVPTKKPIVSISCGWHHTLILDQAGDLFSTGSGVQGAIGQGTKQNSFGFKHIMSGVKQISAGRDHSLAIKGTKVYGWGNTQDGQLGLHSKKCYLSPKQLNVYPCEKIIAGAKFSIFDTIKGLYGCGLNNNYQLGLGHNKNLHYPKLLMVSSELNIVKIWSSNYCFALSDKGQFYVWGTGAFGVYKYPTKMQFFEGSTNFSIGPNFGLAQKDDKIYVWGSNRFGQLGLTQQEQSRQYASQCHTLNTLNLVDFQCGNGFVVGVSQLDEDFQYEKEKQRSMQDKVRQNYYDEQQFQNKKMSSQKSFYSDLQKGKSTKINRVINIHNKFPNYVKNKQSLFINSQSRNKLKLARQDENCLNRSQSHVTIKKYGQKNKKTMEHGIERLATQLQDLKLDVQNRDQKNQNLQVQNQQLRIMLKQQILKQIQIQQQLKQFPIDFSKNKFEREQLKDQIKNKNRLLQKLRGDYSSMANLVESNTFIRSLLGMQNQWTSTPQDWKDSDKHLDQFGGQLKKLQTILQEVNLNIY